MKAIRARAVLSVLGGGACAFIASIPPAVPTRGFPARITCTDLLAAPGEPARARVKLERLDLYGMRPDIPGERLFYFVGEEPVASSYTDEAGWASAELKLLPGLHEVRIATDSARYDVRRAAFGALVLREGQRLLVLAFDDAEAARLLRPHGRVASVGGGGDITLSREEAMRAGEHVIAFVADESESAVWRASGARVFVWENRVPAELDGLLGRRKEE